MENQELKKPTIKEQEYIEQFFATFNKTESARRAKYKNPHVAGFEVFKRPHVQAEIKRRFAERHMGADEIKARISDIGSNDVADYISVRKEFHTPKVKKSLNNLIAEKEIEIQKLRRYLELATLDDKHKEGINYQITGLRNEIIKMQIELEYNPNAFEIVDGEPEEKEVYGIDFKKIKEDKRMNKIKSITQNKNGEIKIDAYDAKDAIIAAGKVAGIFKEDNEQAATKVTVSVTDEQARQIVESIKKEI